MMESNITTLTYPMTTFGYGHDDNISDDKEGNQPRVILLWIPYVLLTVLLISLALASFIRYYKHNKQMKDEKVFRKEMKDGNHQQRRYRVTLSRNAVVNGVHYGRRWGTLTEQLEPNAGRCFTYLDQTGVKATEQVHNHVILDYYDRYKDYQLNITKPDRQVSQEFKQKTQPVVSSHQSWPSEQCINGGYEETLSDQGEISISNMAQTLANQVTNGSQQRNARHKYRSRSRSPKKAEQYVHSRKSPQRRRSPSSDKDHESWQMQGIEMNRPGQTSEQEQPDYMSKHRPNHYHEKVQTRPLPE